MLVFNNGTIIGEKRFIKAKKGNISDEKSLIEDPLHVKRGIDFVFFE